MPDAIKDAPELFSGLEFYFRAFIELNRGRQVAIGRSPLAWRDISDYAARYDLDSEEFDEFSYHLQQMDDEFLALAEEHSKKNKGKTGKPT